MMDKRFLAFVLDVDNTLLASDACVQGSIQHTIGILQGEGGTHQMPDEGRCAEVFRLNLPMEDIFSRLFGQDGKYILDRYREIAPGRPFVATPGARECVMRLMDEGFVCGLLTNRVKLLAQRLREAGIDRVFDFVCQSPAEFRKPHPRAFEDVLRHLAERGIHPGEACMIGDSPDDYWAAKANGIAFIAVLQGGATREDFSRLGLPEHLIIKDLTGLPEALSALEIRETYRDSVRCVSALDGRHRPISRALAPYFSEWGLHRHRLIVEIEHLICLDECFPCGVLPRSLADREKRLLRDIGRRFSERDACAVLEYDHLGRGGYGPSEHDVKACERWLAERLRKTSLADLVPCIHIFLTSEDVNNLAYKTMLAEATNQVLVPALARIMERLAALAEAHVDDPLMSRTHGQPASPTSFGKVFANYLVWLMRGLESLGNVRLAGKVNGAVGNYNAFEAAKPGLDWIAYSKTFVAGLGFDVEFWTDQRGPHGDMVEAFQSLQAIANVIRKISLDLWLYAQNGLVSFAKVQSHVGSSVMPHKVNPWLAEVAEGNVKKANALVNMFAAELFVTRLQRDLSDHDLERDYGTAFGYVLVAVEHLRLGLDMLRPDVEAARQELAGHPEVVTEGLQTVLRSEGIPGAYDLLKDAFRGGKPTAEALRSFIGQLAVSESVREKLFALIDPCAYVGLAPQLTRAALDDYRAFAASARRYLYRS